MTLKELLECEFTSNENGKVVGEIPLERINEIAYILTNQKQRIDKAIEYIKFEWQEIIGNENYSNHLWTIDGLVIKRLLELLGDKENG